MFAEILLVFKNNILLSTFSFAEHKIYIIRILR